MFGQVVSIRVKTLSNTNLVPSRHIGREKTLLPIDVRQKALFNNCFCDGRFFHSETNLRLNGNSVLDSR